MKIEKRLQTDRIPSLLQALTLSLVLGCFVVLSGCATTSGKSAPATASKRRPKESDFDEGDPWENFNRSMFSFNNKVDKAIIAPVARGYSKLPGPITTGVGNFFSNLFEPTTIINDLLQGKLGQAVEDTTRFFLNTTVGIAGLFDVAKHVDLPKNDEDFGQTLARWGVGDGPYLVLPILGPSNVRDTVARVPYFFGTDPVFYVESTGRSSGSSSGRSHRCSISTPSNRPLAQNAAGPLYLYPRRLLATTRESDLGRQPARINQEDPNRGVVRNRRYTRLL